MRSAVVVVLLASAPGCYLSHGRPSDAGTDAPIPMRDAGTDVGSDAGRDAPIVDCEPRVDRIAISLDHDFSMDRTEVTQLEYERFLRCGGTVVEHPGCTGADLMPSEGYDPVGAPDVSVNRVSWCTAASYCRWVGARLCRIEDELRPVCDRVFENVSNSFGFVRPGRCVTSEFSDGVHGYDRHTDFVHPVGSAPDCVAVDPPFDALADVIGNVDELGVDAAGGPTYLGGSIDYGSMGVCEPEHPTVGDVTFRGDAFGFRCCAD